MCESQPAPHTPGCGIAIRGAAALPRVDRPEAVGSRLDGSGLCIEDRQRDAWCELLGEPLDRGCGGSLTALLDEGAGTECLRHRPEQAGVGHPTLREPEVRR